MAKKATKNKPKTTARGDWRPRSILFVGASPHGEAPLQISKEWANITKNINSQERKRYDPGHPTTDKHDPAIFITLAQKLKGMKHCELLHLAGHANEQYFSFVDDAGKSDPIEIEKVVQMINDLPSANRPKYMIVMACGDAAPWDEIRGVDIICHTGDVNDPDALRFVDRLYDIIFPLEKNQSNKPRTFRAAYTITCGELGERNFKFLSRTRAQRPKPKLSPNLSLQWQLEILKETLDPKGASAQEFKEYLNQLESELSQHKPNWLRALLGNGGTKHKKAKETPSVNHILNADFFNSALQSKVNQVLQEVSEWLHLLLSAHGKTDSRNKPALAPQITDITRISDSDAQKLFSSNEKKFNALESHLKSLPLADLSKAARLLLIERAVDIGDHLLVKFYLGAKYILGDWKPASFRNDFQRLRKFASRDQLEDKVTEALQQKWNHSDWLRERLSVIDRHLGSKGTIKASLHAIMNYPNSKTHHFMNTIHALKAP